MLRKIQEGFFKRDIKSTNHKEETSLLKITMKRVITCITKKPSHLESVKTMIALQKMKKKSVNISEKLKSLINIKGAQTHS